MNIETLNAIVDAAVQDNVAAIPEGIDLVHKFTLDNYKANLTFTAKIAVLNALKEAGIEVTK